MEATWGPKDEAPTKGRRCPKLGSIGGYCPQIVPKNRASSKKSLQRNNFLG
jgi:hypothetical protein